MMNAETMAAGTARHADSGLAHTCGVLGTELTQALRRAQTVLAMHAEQVPADTLAGVDRLLQEFARRRIRIAVYGEVKAGKSTLLNAIAGAALSPVAFEPLTAAAIRVTYGPQLYWRAGTRPLETLAALERLMRNRAGAAVDGGEIVVETPLDLLQLGGQVDLLDTPGVGSDTELDAVTAATLRSLDAVILVVRYPALFTEYTRQLIAHLQPEIGKLFVVWNLDAACADLTPHELTRHAAGLRAHIAGAHELLLVDGRAAFNAMQSGNTAACARSGLTMLTDALTRFVSSAHRDVAALREALKRATAWLQDAHQQLAERSAAVERALQLARDRIAAAEQSAEHERTAARDRFSVLETALTGTLTEGKAHADGAAGDLRRRLRSARWQWCRSGDLDALQRAVEVAAQAYSESMSSAAAGAQRGIDVATEQHATPFTAPAQPPLQLDIGDVSSEGRARRALYGHAQLLRRALWQSWYLPGLRHFERDVLPREAQSHAAWLTAAADAARAAGRATLDARLADIARRVAASIADIKTQAQYTELEAEHNALAAHLPVLQAESAAVAQLQAHAAQLR